MPRVRSSSGSYVVGLIGTLAVIPIACGQPQHCASTAECPSAIDVGCDIIDASVGCPMGAQVDLHVSFQAPGGSTVRVFVESITNQVWQGVTTLGTAAKSNQDPHTFVVKPGNATIRGFSADAVPVPVLTPTIIAPTLVPTLNAQALTMKLDVTQRVGNIDVAESSIQQQYSCTASPTDGDKIQLNGRNSPRDAIVLVNGRRSGACKKLEVHRIKSVEHVGNFTESGGCAESVSVFTEDRAVLSRNLQFWTSAPNQTLSLNLAGPVQKQVTIWMLNQPCAAIGCAQVEAELARSILKHTYGGIDLKINAINELQTSSTGLALAAKANAEGECTKYGLDHLAAIGFESSQLNVYYLPYLAPKGKWCGGASPTSRGRNTVLVGPLHTDLTLAHEIGHALMSSVGHPTAGLDGFTNANLCNNLMRQGNAGLHLTLGQLFRANSLPLCTIPANAAACPVASFDVPR